MFLGAASDEEKGLYLRLRPQQFQPAPRRLTEELWQKAIIHPKEDRRKPCQPTLTESTSVNYG